MKSSLSLVYLLIPCLLSCSHPNEKRNLFPLALEEFNAALVWKNFSVAMSYLGTADPRSEVSHLRRQSEKVRIVEVEPLETRVAADGDSATALVRFTWYEEADLTVRKGAELQEWKRVNGVWLIIGRKLPPDEDLAPSPFLRKKPESPPLEPDPKADKDP